jgi:hypothetical protein
MTNENKTKEEEIIKPFTKERRQILMSFVSKKRQRLIEIFDLILLYKQQEALREGRENRYQHRVDVMCDLMTEFILKNYKKYGIDPKIIKEIE